MDMLSLLSTPLSIMPVGYPLSHSLSISYLGLSTVKDCVHNHLPTSNDRVTHPTPELLGEVYLTQLTSIFLGLTDIAKPAKETS